MPHSYIWKAQEERHCYYSHKRQRHLSPYQQACLPDAWSATTWAASLFACPHNNHWSHLFLVSSPLLISHSDQEQLRRGAPEVRHGPKQEFEPETIEECCWTAGWTAGLCSVCFLTTYLGLVPPSRGALTSVNNQDSSPQTCPQAHLTLRLSSQLTLGCVNLTSKAN